MKKLFLLSVTFIFLVFFTVSNAQIQTVVQAGINLTNVNFTVEKSGSSVGLESSVSANYFDLPLLLKVSLPYRSIKPYFLAGGVITLVHEEKTAGEYEVEFKPESSVQNPTSGIYLCRLKTRALFTDN